MDSREIVISSSTARPYARRVVPLPSWSRSTTRTDIGSGAGAQAHAPDVHVVLRAHEADNAVVVDTFGRES